MTRPAASGAAGAVHGAPPPRIAIVSPGDRQTRRHADAGNSRFADLFRAFAARRVHCEPAIYHDDFRDEVRAQLLRVDGVLVWVNPIHEGRDRSLLDAMLREVAAAGVFVSAHPDVIGKLGTKDVLYRTRGMEWGSDTHLYRSLEQLIAALPRRLMAGARVLKQYRGNGGEGVWKVELPLSPTDRGRPPAPAPQATVRVRHARRGCLDEQITLAEFYRRMTPYFCAGGRMIDQAYQQRLSEGMIRCYLVKDRVAGFGHQAINALYPAPPGAPAAEAPPPGPRLYHPPSPPQFQDLKRKLEREWVPELKRLMRIGTDRLPILWDCDFLLGPKTPGGEDRYVLCEINASSVAPYPESAVPRVVDATLAQLEAARASRRDT